MEAGTCGLARRKGKLPYLSSTSIHRVWQKWCDAAGVPYMPPRMGRAYFAVKWHIVEGKSLFNLMGYMRHDDVLATQKYLSKIVDYEDLKAEFNRGKRSPFSLSCNRSESCPLSTPDCYCRMFQPKINSEVTKQHE